MCFICLVVLLLIFQGCDGESTPGKRPADEHVLLPVDMMKKSDCFSCHFVEDHSYGPPYLDIAARYETRDVDVRKLGTKVQEGGGGLWGSTQMSRHPFLKDAEVDTMVTWVLSLAARETALQAAYNKMVPAQLQNGEEGLAVNVYHDATEQYPRDSTQLFSGSADRAGWLPTYRMDAEVVAKEVDLPAVVVAAGTLHIKIAGKYIFRLRGKKTGCLYIDGTQVISLLEADRENLIELSAGNHAIRIESRLTRSSEMVALEWIAPGETYYTVVPEEHLVN